MKTTHIAGIDYGSRLAGTTCIAFIDEDNILRVDQSQKKQCADKFILNTTREYAFQRIFIDAPLSLPIVYQKKKVKKPDFHYRQCDREVGGMSPMFLGGLSARAMKLQYELLRYEIELHEVYPGYMAKNLFGRYRGYKDKSYDIKRYWNHIKASLPIKKIKNLPRNWHEIDAIFALLAGLRYLDGIHQSFGKDGEGIIVI